MRSSNARLPGRAAVMSLAPLDKNKPAAPIWRVAQNGLVTTRRSYDLVKDNTGAMVTGPVNPLLATVGARCDCSTHTVRATSTYCAVAPLVVTLCTKAAQ